MRYYQLLESNDTIENLYSLLDLETMETFISSFKELFRSEPDAARRISNEQKVIQEKIKEEKIVNKLGANYITVYHGTGIDKYHKILADGFQLTKGERSGFMGATYEVDNQGIFLTDSAKVANYFGNNRSPDGHDIFKAYISSTSLLDMSKVPTQLKRKAKELLVPHNGDERINQSNVWWLLDHKEFVDEIRSLGFSGVFFKESIAIRREAGDTKALTYFIIDPNDIILDKHNKSGFGVDEYYAYIKNLSTTS